MEKIIKKIKDLPFKTRKIISILIFSFIVIFCLYRTHLLIEEGLTSIDIDSPSFEAGVLTFLLVDGIFNLADSIMLKDKSAKE